MMVKFRDDQANVWECTYIRFRAPCVWFWILGLCFSPSLYRRQPSCALQVMIECLQNHTPDVIFVDEIGRKQEVIAARDVGNRGVVVWACPR